MADSTTIDAFRISPAAHLGEVMETASRTGSVSLREIPFAVQLGLRTTLATSSAEALAAALGVNLPNAVGEVTGNAEGLHVFWLGPDEFLAVDVSRRQQPGESATVEAALDGLPGQAVDLSANRTILELSGTEARSVLEKTCRADLHPRAFAVGSAILTQVGHVPVILHRASSNNYRLFPRASFADHLVQWLLDGMQEFTKGA